MPNLDPGPIWQKRTRILIAALVKQALAEFQGGASAKGVRMVRHNWQMENGHRPRLEVWATREALSKLAISHNKEGPTPEQVRGILTQFLEKKPLWILEDKRINKKGPEAINWYFFLTLWSTDMEENEKQFEQAWVDGKKKEKGHTPKVSAATYDLTPLPAPLQATIYENINHQENLNIDQCIIDKLVKVIRNKIKPWIIEHCGKMKVLDMSQPVALENIYTTVNILEQITGRQRKEVEELFQKSNYLELEDFDRFSLGKIKEKNISGLEAVNKYEKLLILGKPGAGKTTFIKYLALHCINEINEKKWAESVPIFITLKHFAETKGQPDLESFILKLVGNDKITQLLKSGQVLVLLDGLDEVKEADNDRVLREIQDFTEKFWENKFVLTCRIAAKEYTFERFTEVEIADFNDKQISAFASNWFKDKEVKAEIFINKIEEDIQVKELATNPLLLTLLCLTFEEAGSFPASRAELYKEAIDALLKKWDAKRGIERDQVYKKLWLARKEDLLSQLAWATFEQGDYFFKQRVAEQHIAKYVRNLPDASTDSEALQTDSEVILKSIEAQHGLLVERAKKIYSFSHLTFHEYFAAREVIQREVSSKAALQKLVSHMKEGRWREVFIIAVEMSPQADRLLQLMKEEVDALIADNTKLQSFLEWVQNKSSSVETNYKSAAVRAYYLDLDLSLALAQNHNHTLNLAHALDHTLAHDLAHDLGFARSLTRDRTLVRVLIRNFDRTRDLIRAFERDLARNQNPEFSFVIQKLKDRSCSSDSLELSQQWWRDEGQVWIKDLQTAMNKYRNIGYDWDFTQTEKELLQQYYNMNLLLVRCFSECYISREFRQKIEEALLLPIAEIKKPQ